MPIRINLLAEAQAAEELRRKDPVKRAVLAGACIVLIVGVRISILQVNILAKNSQLTNLQSSLSSRTNQYYSILQDKQRLQEDKDKLKALNRLAANRFLQGTLLDAPMHATIDGIQLTHLRTEQVYDQMAEVKQIKTEQGKIITAGKPASTVARYRLILDAKDTSANPGNEQITKFKEILAQTPYFKSQQISTNNILLKNLSSPQQDTETGKAFVAFSLECQYPDNTRL